MIRVDLSDQKVRGYDQLRPGQTATKPPRLADPQLPTLRALPPAPRSIEECDTWGDGEIGLVVRLLFAGWSLQDIAGALGEPDAGDRSALDRLVRRIKGIGVAARRRPGEGSEARAQALERAANASTPPG